MADKDEELIVSGDPGAESSISTLAAALIAAERSIEQQRPSRVVLADDSDAALAAAIAAVKFELPLLTWAGARDRSTSNGRLIEQLATDLDFPG